MQKASKTEFSTKIYLNAFVKGCFFLSTTTGGVVYFLSEAVHTWPWTLYRQGSYCKHKCDGRACCLILCALLGANCKASFL